MQITVKTLDGQARPFTVEEDVTVRQLKELIAREMDIPLERQRLIFQGRVLVDEKQLSEYKVDGKTLHLVQRLPNSEMPPTSASASEQPQVPPATPPPNMSIEELRTVVQQVLNGLGEVTRGANVTLRDTGHGVEVHVELPSHAAGQTGAHRVSIARIRKAFLERTFTQIERLIAFLERLAESDADESAPIPVMPPADSDALSDQPQTHATRAEPSESQTPTLTQDADASRPLPIGELAALYDRLAALQVRSASQMRLWTELLRVDASFQSSTPAAPESNAAPSTARRRAQVRHEVTGRLMHLIAHVTHNLSDFIVEFNETPPRNLLVLTDTPVQTAVLVQPGLPFPGMPQGPQMHVSPFAFPLGTPPQPQAGTRPTQAGATRATPPGAPFMPPGFPLSVGQFGVPVARMAGPGIPQFGIGLSPFAARNGVDASGARFTALSTPPRTFVARGPGDSMTLNNVSAHVVAAYRPDDAGGAPNAATDAAQAGYTDMLRQVLDQTIRQSLAATGVPLGPGSPPNNSATAPRVATPIRAPNRLPQPRLPIGPNPGLVWPPMMPTGFENQHTLDAFLPCTSRHWSLVEPNTSRDGANAADSPAQSPLSITININTTMPGVLVGNQPRSGTSPQNAASRQNAPTATNTSTASQASTTNTPPRPSLPTGAGPFPLPFPFAQSAFGVGPLPMPFPPQGAVGAPFVMMPPLGAFLGGQPQGAQQAQANNLASMMFASAMPLVGSMLNALLGGGPAQPNLTLFDVLQGAMTQAGESLPDDVLSDLLRAVLRVLTITDMPAISLGNNEPIDRLRAPLRAYLVRSLFVNAADGDAARRESGASSTVDDAHVDRVLASVTTAQIDDAAALFARPLVPLLESLLDSDEEEANSQFNTTLWLNTFRSRPVDVDRTLERLTRREAARLIRVIIDPDRVNFATRLRDTLDQSITALISVLDAVIDGGLNALENSLRNRAAQLAAASPPNANDATPNAPRPSNFLARFPGAADYLVDSLFRQLIATRRNRLLATDELAEYIVTETDDQGPERTTERRRLTVTASANNADEQMATDADREQFDTPPESMVTDSDETPSTTTTAKPTVQTNASVPEPLESAALDARLLEEATANVAATVGESIVAVFGLTVEADDELEAAANASLSLPQQDNASWQRAVPASWLPTMLRDADTLNSQPSSAESAGPSASGDLSDAYLGGLPSKRRKTLNVEKAEHARFLRVGDANSSARSLRSLVEQAANQLHLAPLAARSNASAAANPYAVLEHELHDTTTGGQQLTTQFAGEIERQFAGRASSFAESDRAKAQYTNVVKLLDKTAQQRSDADDKN